MGFYSTEQSKSYQYDAFGNTVVKNRTKVDDFDPCLGLAGFSSERIDRDAKLIYYNYLYYNPKTGRWLSRDPIEEKGGVNLYAFVGNSAIDRWDVLGLAVINSASDARNYWRSKQGGITMAETQLNKTLSTLETLIKK